MNFFGRLGVFPINLGSVEGLAVVKSVHYGVLLTAGVFDVRAHEVEIEEIGDTESAASHFVFVCRTDTARSSADLDASWRVLGGELDHSVIGKNDLGAIGDEKIAVDLDASFAERFDFFE